MEVAPSRVVYTSELKKGGSSVNIEQLKLKVGDKFKVREAREGEIIGRFGYSGHWLTVVQLRDDNSQYFPPRYNVSWKSEDNPGKHKNLQVFTPEEYYWGDEDWIECKRQYPPAPKSEELPDV